jgi:hypothetical protein
MPLLPGPGSITTPVREVVLRGKVRAVELAEKRRARETPISMGLSIRSMGLRLSDGCFMS